jgi:protein associated with RNAse G/E
MWHLDWRPRMHYVNIATPATWHDGTLRFIDLDLDVIWRAESGEVILDDEDEFAQHQVRFGYPRDLIEQVQHSAREVLQLIAQSAYPFDGSLFTWRPDGSPK